MEINRQLFEDIILGKLKGTFVLKNGTQFNDSQLTDIYVSTVVLGKTTYYFNGKPIVSDYKGILDVIDFIPETNMKENMKENELTIEIPNEKIVDWDESKKQNKIVLKDKQLTYDDVCKKLFQPAGIYFITAKGNIGCFVDYDHTSLSDSNNATTKHQLQCILAKNQLANVAKYLNDGWKPNKGDHVFWLTGCGDLVVGAYYFGDSLNQIIFKTQEAAQQAVKILGEETIKLALEPLGV